MKKNLYLGSITTADFIRDPKRLAITLSRYKFVGKMFEDFESILEIGAGDGFKSLSLKESFKKIVITDISKKQKLMFDKNYNFKNIKYKQHNFLSSDLDLQLICSFFASFEAYF